MVDLSSSKRFVSIRIRLAVNKNKKISYTHKSFKLNKFSVKLVKAITKTNKHFCLYDLYYIKLNYNIVTGHFRG